MKYILCAVVISSIVLLSLASFKDHSVTCDVLCGVSHQTSLVNASVVGQAEEMLFGLFRTDYWPARWDCGTWTPLHGWTYIISDVIIWLSYFMIPLTLSYFVYRRKTEPLPFKNVMVLFIVFILACGLTHLIDAVIFWWPAYRLSAVLRLVTAFVSLGTVFALIRIAPQVIDLKTPSRLEEIVKERTQELQDLNEKYENEIRSREQAEMRLKNFYAELEESNKGLEESNRILLRREHDLIKSEERVKELNANLEKLVEQRTHELQVSNRELEAFTYSVSHDLRAPLRAIDGYARILEEDYQPHFDANGNRLIQVITKNAKYMGQLIDDLLEFSRTSRLEPKPSMFDTATEVRLIFEEYVPKHSPVEIRISDLHTCRGDYAMLKQVWVNLISNAVKYSRNVERPKIEVGSFETDNSITFYIKDNGVGFDMEYVHKLFGVFQRLHRKEEFEGTGVGLALVKRILERHRGTIRAEAALGKGATFYFTLPV